VEIVDDGPGDGDADLRSGPDDAGRTADPPADQPKMANRSRPVRPIRVKAPPAAMRCRAG
jgi:hypothetical protein